MAVDPATGEVGGASATCTPWAWAVFGVVPGKGIIATQAWSNPQARKKGVELLKAGASPAAVIAAITDERFDPTRAKQQHGVAALGFARDSAGYSGARTAAVTGDLQAEGVSVQGNILADRAVLTAALEAFLAAGRDPSTTLAERLLLALEAGAAEGGDRRCGAQTAMSAYLVVARPDDWSELPAIRITIGAQDQGGRNPVELLRERFEQSVAP